MKKTQSLLMLAMGGHGSHPDRVDAERARRDQWTRSSESDAVIRTVDLVISGDGGAALAAAVEALQRGRRVLVVLRSSDSRLGRCFRRCLCRTASTEANQVTVMTNAEIVCVDGVDGVEAVVIRYTRTGRRCAVNASAFLSCDALDLVPAG